MSVQTTETKSNCSKFSLKSDLAGCSTLHFLHFDIIPVVYKNGGDSSNKGCFGRKTNLFRESGDFAGKRET